VTDQEFRDADTRLIEHADKVLLNRKAAYAQEGDRLANFKETAIATGLTPEKVCEVYLYKALSSMLKILHGAPAIGESLDDRFSDPLNYVRLAYGLVCERNAKKAPVNYDSLLAQYKPPKRDPLLERLVPRAANRILD